MKKTISAIFASLMILVSSHSFAQMSVEGLLDKAVSLAGKSGNSSQVAELLGKGVSMLETEANTGSADMKSKLLGQVGGLKNLIPLATSGKLNLGSLGKIVNTIKMLVAANRLKNMLGGGKSSLLGKGSAITSNLNLLQSASSVLGSGVSSQFSKLLGSTTKSVGKLDKSGLFGKLAAGATEKKLGKLVNLVSGAL
ncbi:hypothetical protein EGI22_20045 [Lacihabitans sp. LS3-19]|uniref:hypothetical protein n=1 Tax=Lacihabitans sp. LS3-19 TaxID=2487335 RepID=UPI0020CDEE89|nr:hypothetical protein [Lacihabitans sp. LS3-19]MCP9770203.1 hypothetical protein [Lacihabitans sp. LS3-19]